MSTVDVLEIPKQTGPTPAELDVSSSTPLPPKTAKIVVGDQVFEVEDSLTTSFALGKLLRTEDGSYRFPDEWGVGPTQFLVLFDYLRSTK